MTFTDQMHRTVPLSVWPPRRIVSLVPSQTELLADLGLDDQVVGITKFCVHPLEWFQNKPRIGGTKNLNFEKIAALQPDLIIGNKEENQQEQIETLEKHFPVWMSDIVNLQDALDMVRAIGQLTDRSETATQMVSTIESEFQGAGGGPQPKVAYLIWRKPFMAAGNGTFIQEMLNLAGFRNVFGDRMRYPETTLAELAEIQPDAILLSSEPYPFAEKHIATLQQACPGSKILLVDGELFSWYGSRLLQAPAYFKKVRQMLE